MFCYVRVVCGSFPCACVRACVRLCMGTYPTDADTDADARSIVGTFENNADFIKLSGRTELGGINGHCS